MSCTLLLSDSNKEQLMRDTNGCQSLYGIRYRLSPPPSPSSWSAPPSPGFSFEKSSLRFFCFGQQYQQRQKKIISQQHSSPSRGKINQIRTLQKLVFICMIIIGTPSSFSLKWQTNPSPRAFLSWRILSSSLESFRYSYQGFVLSIAQISRLKHCKRNKAACNFRYQQGSSQTLPNKRMPILPTSFQLCHQK